MDNYLKFNEYDIVRINKINKRINLVGDGISKRPPVVGDHARVVMVYKDQLGYELECCDSEGDTLWLLSVANGDLDLELVTKAPVMM
jgi:hypothetical protein